MPFEKKLVTRTLDGIALQPLYTRADLQRLPHVKFAPGEVPFVRGTRPGGNQGRAWKVAQELRAATPADFNQALTSALMRGQDAVVIESPALPADLPAWRTALAGVDISAVPVHLDAGVNALPTAALYMSFAAENRQDWGKLTGGITADPLTAWVTDGKLERGWERELDALAGWTRWAANHAPNLRSVRVNARIWGDAGATVVQELAFALAAGAEYLRALNERGISIETAAKRIQFTFAIGPQFFTEIAKFRAWRPLWTRVVAAFGGHPELGAAAAVHAATGSWNKTLLDPHVNMLRVTTEALSAVLGGCDSLHVSPYDELTGAPNDFSHRIARNVHVLLAEEFGFTHPADPAGGSWYVETLTDDVARKAWELFQTIAARGGFAAALREGLPQKLVSEAAGEKADAVGRRRMALIGTNVFPNLREKPLTIATPVAAASAAKTTVALPRLAPKASWPERFEAALAVARAGASTADIATLAGAKTRRPDPIQTVAPFRAAAGFEQLRSAAEAWERKTGKRPRVFLAKIGPAIQHKARADFSAGFFASGGFEVQAKQTFETATAAAEAAAGSGAPVAVLCSTDDTYPELVPAFAAAAKAARPGLKVVLAGLPAEPQVVEAYRTAGVDEFIHMRANVHATLAKLLKEMGALA
ncbi:MAG TPA: methylmalonyl-CoA mutase family protein [Opitutaceae bacterium]|nr:methylmalonyl-CoA mutase family protein [Opitutaceae bacterium]